MDLQEAKNQLKQCLIASKNRRDLGHPNPNFPDTDRYTISIADLTALKTYFFGLQQDNGEFETLYPVSHYRFEVATSGSQGPDVHDFKISPRTQNGTGPAIFNFHIEATD
ncbi:hypothetical protein NBRC116602_00540 [Hyphomicrobiales bacterium 4NK60-0047b]